MMKVNYYCTANCGTDNCYWRNCMFYSGLNLGTVRCLAEEKSSIARTEKEIREKNVKRS